MCSVLLYDYTIYHINALIDLFPRISSTINYKLLLEAVVILIWNIKDAENTIRGESFVGTTSQMNIIGANDLDPIISKVGHFSA